MNPGDSKPARMNSLFHAPNIGTLAAWLTVAAFGMVAIVAPASLDLFKREQPEADPFADLESVGLTEDFSVGDRPSSEETDTGEADAIAITLLDTGALSEPPEMPATADFAPLPDVPEFPSTRPAVKTVPRPARRTETPTRPTGGSTRGTATGQGKSGSGGSGGGSGMSDAKRLAGGRMPPPSYPAAARSRGQEGTVVVEFVVGTDGRVISASARSASPWPLLNSSALSCVRRWRFPAGGTTKYVRPITFKLN